MLHQGSLYSNSPLRDRKLGKLRPWGWSADSHLLLRDLLPSAAAENSAAPWNPEVRELYTKTRAAEFLAALPWQAAFGDRSIIGSADRSIEEIWETGQTALAKANFGIAGRRMARFTPGDDLAPLEPLLQLPGGVIIEPWLDRIADFSVQYEIEPNELPRLKGFVRLHCEPSGRFTACVASGTFSRLLPPEVARFVNHQGTHWLKQLYAEILPATLNEFLSGTGFRGYLGIDAFFYRDSTGEPRLKPIVEINPRCTMGRTTLELLRVAAPGRTVLFRILSKQAVTKAGHVSLAHAASFLKKQHPIVLTEAPQVASGLFTLNDPTTATHFLATALVANHALEPEEIVLR